MLDGREVFAGASIGIATGRRSAEDLLRQADVAMYRAKAEGKGRYALYESGMQAEVLERLELEADLQRALERGELELYYQPIIALGSGALDGVEALLRWRHPERGMVGPMSFIPVAEETGLIVDIGRYVLLAACEQAAAWRAAGAPEGLTMNVNLSGRQLDDPELLETVAGALRASGIEPGTLVLEITRDGADAGHRDHDRAAARPARPGHPPRRRRLRDGYSSLRYLNRFPVDVLKMAKPFVDGLGAGAEHAALARAIVDLGANLGLQIIAEGIERPEQLAQLQRLGCALGQGFHFSVPLPASEIGPLVVGQSRPASRSAASAMSSGAWAS